MAGEVKEEERDRLPVVGREEGEGERGEAKENWGAGLFPDGEKRLTGAAFVLERERERGREEREGGRRGRRGRRGREGRERGSGRHGERG